jgi:hypothetical protein
MAYYLLSDRGLSMSEQGRESLARLPWPAELQLQAELVPDEVFGPSEINSPRVMVLPGQPVQFTIDPNLMKATPTSDLFPPPVQLKRSLFCPDVQVEFSKNVVTLACEVEQFNEVREWVAYLDYVLPSSLSVAFGVFINSTKITGRLGETVNFCCLFPEESSFYRLCAVDDATRSNRIDTALKLMNPRFASYDRFLVSATYFHQALRLCSPHETISPIQCFTAEIFLNLAKGLEILFGGTRDALRQNCRVLGYSDKQIESQLVPILLIRSRVDIAHAVGSSIPMSEIAVVRQYAMRAIENTKALLSRVSRHLEKHDDFLQPIAGRDVADRLRLTASLRSYLEEDRLPD